MKRSFEKNSISNELEDGLLLNIFTFYDIWNDYSKFILSNLKDLELGGEQKIILVPFPQLVYSKIYEILFPKENLSSSFELLDKEIEKLNFLFGVEGVFEKKGWCFKEKVSKDKNISLWWIVKVKASFQINTQKLIFTFYSLKSLNGMLLTPVATEKRKK